MTEPRWFRHAVKMVVELGQRPSGEEIRQAVDRLAEWVAGRVPGAELRSIEIRNLGLAPGQEHEVFGIAIGGYGTPLDEMVQPDPKEVIRQKARLVGLIARSL